jgi:hypothetical protein
VRKISIPGVGDVTVMASIGTRSLSMMSGGPLGMLGFSFVWGDGWPRLAVLTKVGQGPEPSKLWPATPYIDPDKKEYAMGPYRDSDNGFMGRQG